MLTGTVGDGHAHFSRLDSSPRVRPRPHGSLSHGAPPHRGRADLPLPPAPRPPPPASPPPGPPPHRGRGALPLHLALPPRPRRRVPPADREHGHEPRGR